MDESLKWCRYLDIFFFLLLVNDLMFAHGSRYDFLYVDYYAPSLSSSKWMFDTQKGHWIILKQLTIRWLVNNDWLSIFLRMRVKCWWNMTTNIVFEVGIAWLKMFYHFVDFCIFPLIFVLFCYFYCRWILMHVSDFLG